MLHRTTWIAAPIIALVVVGAGLGWWGYDQQQQRQALAIETENQYSSAYHSLVADFALIDEELGKCLIFADKTSFQRRVRDVWRLSYAAQGEIARLPIELMPMHHTQQFLSEVGNEAKRWMDSQADPTNPGIHRSVAAYYREAGQTTVQLETMQARLLESGNLRWLAVQRAVTRRQEDNQIVDGFRKMDTAASAYVESRDDSASLQRGRTYGLQTEDTVSARQAISALAEFLGIAKTTDWTVDETGRGSFLPRYVVHGSVAQGQVTGIVSKHGGHVLSFVIHRSAKSDNFDLGEAQDRAVRWLAGHGFGPVETTSVAQYKDAAYIVFNPTRRGRTVANQPVSVRVSLDNGDIVAYDASKYFQYPVRSVPTVEYSEASLRRKLSSDFQVRMTRPVLLLDEEHRYQPAIAFYGTANGETYRVYMNQHTGEEMQTEQLTRDGEGGV